MRRLILFLCQLFACFPRFVHLGLGCLLGRLAWELVSYRRKLTIKNIALAFPEAANHKALAKQCFEHFGHNLVEMFLLPAHKKLAFLHFKGQEIYIHRQKGRGSLLLTAHIGNWEWISCLTRFDLPILGIYQAQRNKLVENLLFWLRESTGVQLLEHKFGVKEGLRGLKTGAILGNVGDQGKGIDLLFFGRKTAFPIGPVRLALQAEVPLVLTRAWRKGANIEVEVLGELPLAQGASREEIIEKTMISYIQILEAWIREEPAQYFWMHNLWKLNKEDL